MSDRRDRPFIEVNCAGLTPTFLDSELFGHEKGAYTDAKDRREGLFEAAHTGVLFLDEVGDLAPELQPKLLKVLEVVIKLDLGREGNGTTDDIGDLHVTIPQAGVVPIVDLLERAGPTRSAMHHKDGVFVVKGPGIRSGHQVLGAAVTDVMPTLLCAAGLTPPIDIDGKALDLFV